MPNMMKRTERALHKKTNKILIGATKQYKRLMRQAAKAASDHKREQYLAAALGALVVTGVVASRLKARMKRKKNELPTKNSKKKSKR
jgi:hypothetical protein